MFKDGLLRGRHILCRRWHRARRLFQATDYRLLGNSRADHRDGLYWARVVKRMNRDAWRGNRGYGAYRSRATPPNRPSAQTMAETMMISHMYQP